MGCQESPLLTAVVICPSFSCSRTRPCGILRRSDIRSQNQLSAHVYIAAMTYEGVKLPFPIHPDPSDVMCSTINVMSFTHDSSL